MSKDVKEERELKLKRDKLKIEVDKFQVDILNNKKVYLSEADPEKKEKMKRENAHKTISYDLKEREYKIVLDKLKKGPTAKMH